MPVVASVGILSLPVDGSTVRLVRPPLLGIVIATSVGATGLPFKRSLLNISTVPPFATEVSGSSFATIVGAGAVTLISAIALSTVPQPVSSTQ